MSEYIISPNVDVEAMFHICKRYFRLPEQVFYDNGLDAGIKRVIFTPDLSQNEEKMFFYILENSSSFHDFENLPNYATWTPQESYDNAFNAIFNGADQTTINSQIDALPNTVAGIKVGLKTLASEIINIRLILATSLKMIAYLRNLVVKTR